MTLDDHALDFAPSSNEAGRLRGERPTRTACSTTPHPDLPIEHSVPRDRALLTGTLAAAIVLRPATVIRPCLSALAPAVTELLTHELEF